MAISSSNRALLATSAVWLLLIVACAYIAYPTIGPVAVSVSTNPFWDVAATGSPESPFNVTGRWSYMLVAAFGPVSVLWLATFVIRRYRPRSGERAA